MPSLSEGVKEKFYDLYIGGPCPMCKDRIVSWLDETGYTFKCIDLNGSGGTALIRRHSMWDYSKFLLRVIPETGTIDLVTGLEICP